MQADPAPDRWVLLVGSGSLKLRSWLVGMGLPPGKALPARRSFFQGSAHPVFLPTSPVVTPQGSLTLFDAGTFYSSCLQGALYGGYLDELVAACERSCVLLLQAEPLDATSRSLVQLARLCGVERAIVLGKPPAAKELGEELLACGLPGVVSQTSGSLSAAARCRCGQIGCGHCAPLRELIAELDATPGRTKISRPFAMGAIRATGYGVTPGLRIVIGARRPQGVAREDELDILTRERTVRGRVQEVTESGVVFEGRGLKPENILGVASPGAARFATRLEVASVCPDGRATLPARADLFSLGRRWGRCRLTRTGSRHLLELDTGFLFEPEGLLLLVEVPDLAVSPITLAFARPA